MTSTTIDAHRAAPTEPGPVPLFLAGYSGPYRPGKHHRPAMTPSAEELAILADVDRSKQRYGRCGRRKTVPDVPCKVCGTPYHQVNKTQQTCSYACGGVLRKQTIAAKQALSDELDAALGYRMSRKAPPRARKDCPMCGRQFRPANVTTETCSRRCGTNLRQHRAHVAEMARYRAQRAQEQAACASPSTAAASTSSASP